MPYKNEVLTITTGNGAFSWQVNDTSLVKLTPESGQIQTLPNKPGCAEVVVSDDLGNVATVTVHLRKVDEIAFLPSPREEALGGVLEVYISMMARLSPTSLLL